MGYQGGSSDAAAQARADESARKSAINQGIARIDATFAGNRGTGQATTYDPNAKYFNDIGAQWSPDEGGIKAGYDQLKSQYLTSGTNARGGATRAPLVDYETYAKGARQDATKAAIAAGKLFTGKEISGGFDDNFYAQRAKDYEDVALPALGEQYREKQGTITENLSRRGLLNSGAAIRARTALDKYAQGKKRDIGDQAIQQENALRSDVANQRQQLVNQTISSGDSTLASTGALQAAAQLRRPTGFAPIGQLFGDFTNTLAANQVAQSYDPSVKPILSFGSPKKSNSLSIV